ncbi:unnamed protein product [Parascedosporium putredinis]|uniref:MOSC domain-containing protein n=1 Tax=Parascedosporium putredinis TaxID=1442378 RepID=A0A9P1M516_9PEZI|nr:unnamed protein product [Parascedosporium putredinis]CAI7987624.1 unnamed protein product [Parascedosporium putredinis]
MKITGVPRLTPQGLKYDRRFSLWRIPDDGVSLREKIQVFTNPEAALFDQRVVGLDEDDVDKEEKISYAPHKTKTPVHTRAPAGAPDADGADHPSQATELRVPLCPDTTNLDPVTVTMYKSSATAFRMGREYDAWFTACFGFPVALVYIGDGRRPQLGFQPGTPARTPQRSPLAALLHILLDCVARCVAFLLALPTLAAAEGGKRAKHPPPKAPGALDHFYRLCSLPHRLRVLPCPPLRERERHPARDAPLPPQHPHRALVAPDRPGHLSVAGSPVFKLTGNCARCTSVNVDYETGRPTKGPRGTVLKTLAKTRRVDKGKRWEAIFGRYASLAVAPETSPRKWWAGGEWGEEGAAAATATPVTKVAVGDPVRVTRRNRERDVWDWPPLK